MRVSQAAGPLWQRIEKELGRETMLRLLWPHLVGAQLAANTRLMAIRGATLVIAAPDRAWIKTLDSFRQMILNVVNRLPGGSSYDSVEFVEGSFDALPADIASRNQPRKLRLTQTKSPDEFLAPVVNIDTTVIRNDALRSVFALSAGKYFAAQSARTRH